MTDYLMLTLYAPMAAMGDIAVGERRMSSNTPAKSAVLGLIAGALGIDRTEVETHAALNAGYGYGVLTCNPGRPLDDYHTVQTASEPSIRKLKKLHGQPPSTRRELLKAESLETLVTTRAYRTDALYIAALWRRDNAPYTLEDISQAVEHPHYTPCFGRKSCPFALPLFPEIVNSADTLDDAFSAHLKSDVGQKIFNLLHDVHCADNMQFLADADASLRGEPLYRQKRRDQILNRKQWQFLPRDEIAGQLRMGDYNE